MQVLTAGQYGALGDLSRAPCARVKLEQNFDSIPFAGRAIQTTEEHEITPRSILHSSGRICTVYSKQRQVSGAKYYHIYFRCTNIARTLWEDEVDLHSTSAINWTTPTLRELDNGTIGIVAVYNATTLYKAVVSQTGTISSAFASMTITGNSPSLTTVGSTYWMAYEASGILYVRTSADFITWSAATDYTAKTGLTNGQYSPCLYYDSSNKLWFAFERISDISVTPNVYNVYYMTSVNQGTDWSASTAMTTFAAGEGSAYTPTLVDTGAHRYFGYAYRRSVINNTYGTGENQFFQYDETNDRVIFLTGANHSNYALIIYDVSTALYTVHYIVGTGKFVGTSIFTSGLSYDNGVFAISASGDNGGLLIYDESTTNWTLYNATSTPALYSNHVFTCNIEDGIVYYSTYGNSFYDRKLAYLTLSTNVVTDMGADIDYILGGTAYGERIYISATYICYYLYATGGPYFRAYQLSDKAQLFSTTITKTGYSLFHLNGAYFSLWSTPAYDLVNDVFWTMCQETADGSNKGIVSFQVTSSGITEIDYWQASAGNSYGLLPHPDAASNKVSLIINMIYDNNRLIIFSQTSLGTSDVNSEMFITVFNTSTSSAISYFSFTDSDDYAANFPAIDAVINKVLLRAFARSSSTILNYHAILNSDRELIYQTTVSTTYRWHLLSVEGETSRLYYSRTDNDSDWSTAAFLTQGRDDISPFLFYTNRLSIIYYTLHNSIYALRWDEDLSEAIDLTAYVERFEISKTIESEANTATLTLTDSQGLFDPLNYNSLFHTYLAENNIITIEKGNNGNYTASFYGYITAGRTNYSRGNQILYNIKCDDRSKTFYRNQITTELYENQTVSAIANSIAITHMGLAVGEINLPTITETIPTVQFIEEYPMDILNKLFQPFNYFVDFDELGVLRAVEFNYEAATDFTYYEDGTDSVAANKAPAFNIASYEVEWDDTEIVNKVEVIGETSDREEVAFDEEYMGFISGAAGWFTKKNTVDFYFSTDKTLKCIEPRLSVQDSCGNRFFGGGETISAAGAGKQDHCTITIQVSQVIQAVFGLIVLVAAASILFGAFAGVGSGVAWVFDPKAALVALLISMIGQISGYQYTIHAKPVGEPLPETIIATAEDQALIDKYGEIKKEIDNPFLDTYEKCNALATDELAKAQWFVYKPIIRVMGNPAFQIGDVIEAYNPQTDNPYKIYITEITQSYARGQQDVDTIQGGLIN